MFLKETVKKCILYQVKIAGVLKDVGLLPDFDAVKLPSE